MITTGEAVVMSLSILRPARFRAVMLVALVALVHWPGGVHGARQCASIRVATSAGRKPTALPEDIEAQVHSFCGASCHAYPPADAFPKSHWRMEVERAFASSISPAYR